MKHLILLLALLGGAAAANAGSEPAPSGGLSIDRALDEARAHSPEYRQSAAAAEEASWRPLEALSGNIPRVSVGASHFFSLKYQLIDVNLTGTPVSFPAVYPKSQVNLDFNWTVFDGLSSWNSYLGAKRGKEAAALEFDRAALELEVRVRFSFDRALAAQRLAVVADENLKALREHERRAKELLKQGEATRFDTLRIETQLSEAVPEKLSAEDNAVLARRALTRAMGLDLDERPLEGVLPIPTSTAVDPGLQFDVAARGDVQARVLRAEAADKAHSASLGTWLPKVSLAGEKQYYNSGSFQVSPSSFNDAYNVGVFVSWNIFDGGASYARQRMASSQRVQSEAAASAALLQAPEDFELWKRRYFYNVSLYDARTSAIVTAEESVRLATLGFRAGSRTSTDVLDAELDLFRARAGAVRAQLDAAEAFLNLELALGRKI